jgi:isoquinoline 1-oxidoreductase alpha subunit
MLPDPARAGSTEVHVIPIYVNGTIREVDATPETPLLWVLRDALSLTGTKFGCGVGSCGSCTVLLDGEPVQSCQVPVSAVGKRRITTIEGLSPDGSHPVQRAWVADEVPQCGYCQPAQIVAATALLARKPHPTDADIDDAMYGILCRCGTYERIRRAIHRAAKEGVR